MGRENSYRTTKDIGEDADWGSIVTGFLLAASPVLFTAIGIAFPDNQQLTELSLEPVDSALFVVYGVSVAAGGWLESYSDYFKWVDDPAALVGIGFLGVSVFQKATEFEVSGFTTFLAAATVFLAVPSAAAKYLTRGGRI
jgi:hypothetical protein|nr:MAG: hypothetical protein J07AB56_06290 [Candidatus Nanosalinarum sp. J07AB56]